VFAAEKGMQAAVVATIEWRRPFVGADDARRGGKKAREEARSCGKRLEAAGRKSGNAR
jgi:hypothetical protein